MARIALQVIAFNVDTWISKMLGNASPHVDKIFLAYPSRPWMYNSESRERLINPTKLESISLNDLACEVEIVQGDWAYEEDTRNELLCRARSEKFDWQVIQDADEFYTVSSWKRLRQEMESNESDDLLVTPWINFWKSPQFVLVNKNQSLKSLNEGFAIRANGSDRAFIYCRTSNCVSKRVLDEPCYHYGYVLDDNALQLKLRTWGHSKDVWSRNLWLRCKWQNWNESTKFLHPSSPSEWIRAIRAPMDQPDFALDFMSINNLPGAQIGVLESLIDCVLNLLAIGLDAYRGSKRLLRVSLGRLNSKRISPR